MSQICNHAQLLKGIKKKQSGRPLDNQTWQTEWKTAPLTKVQLLRISTKLWKLLLQPAICVQSLIVLSSQSRFFTLLVATAHDCESGLLPTLAYYPLLTNAILKLKVEGWG